MDDAPPVLVHQAIAHDSAIRHVAGAAPYIDDLPEPAGTLHLALGLAPVARGRITRLDLDKVRAAPDVVAVFTANDVPGRNDVSPSFGDEPMLADEHISFHSQPVFLVAATTRKAARLAARLGEIDVEPELASVTIPDALSTGETVLPDYTFGRGHAEPAIDGAAHRLAGEIEIGGQEHFYLEGQIALAVPGEGETMFVLSSTQHPSEVQHIVARVLGVRDHQVTIECRRMGGGFGGKESQASHWAALAALAARLTGKPGKLRLDRDEDFALTGKRHDFLSRYRVGYTENGLIEGIALEHLARCGYSADLSLGVVDRTMFHSDNAYYLPHVEIASKRLKTNTVSNTAFRGFGGPQGVLAVEQVIDAIARERGQDPLDTRKANFYRDGGSITPYGMEVFDRATLLPLVETLETSSDYRTRRATIKEHNAHSPILKRGLALTPVKFGISFTLKHLNQAG
ncbi:MAG TPA: molybdopterin-dependent oxidoreductase, partial [Rhabdaerophilum sp.]|nr:molybdopterin-dependent oxidoreductase [Rhabdaerophilum sp.]